jgi:hypothetical protein
VDKEIKVEFDFSTRKDRTMSVALERSKTAALGKDRRAATAPQVQDNGLDDTYRAACARDACERRMHLVRRRNLTNRILFGTAL